MTDASAIGKRSRRKGKRGEREALKWLREHGVECERTSEFEGDIILQPPQAWSGHPRHNKYLLEVKYHNEIYPATLRPELERGKHFVMWREPRKQWQISLVVSTLADFTTEYIIWREEDLDHLVEDIIITLLAEDWVKLWLAK